MTDSINFAILGPGSVADFHRQAIEANAGAGARLAAVAHYNPARFEALSARFGVPCRTQADVLADPAIDVVVICTPSGQHAGQAIAAAQAGKHVLVDKPMATSLADADAMIAACEQAGVKLGVSFQRRNEPQFIRARQAIEAGDFGELALGAVTIPYFRPQSYYDSGGWRGTWAGDGGGVLMNQGIHLVDILLWLMGNPVEIRAHAGTLHRRIDVEDTLSASLRFANGALATICATTTAAPGFPHRVEIFGTRGGFQVEGSVVTRWLVAEPAAARIAPPPTGGEANAGAGSDPKGEGPALFMPVYREFIRAVREDASPQVDGREGRRSLATVLDIYKSAGIYRASLP
ncbi:MAG: gfo/Idh/MocA family oxidoreductase [Chloroflexi bacterium]|nr:MAG: gfo/Idh/MocA family oxidoreductase [Chloroflexota bacterium]